jgi:uncharacterized protein YbjT (DUF2867 family)
VPGALEHSVTWAQVARESDAVVHLAGIQFVGWLLRSIDGRQPLTVISSASVRSAAHPRSSELRDAEGRLFSGRPRALTILRPTMIYGSPRDRNMRLLARLIARLPTVPQLAGGGAIQPVFADDVADAIVTTLGTAGHLEADLGGPMPLRLGDVVSELARFLNRPVTPLPIPVPALAWLGELICRVHASPGLHALAMLRHDRIVAPPDPRLLGHAPTSFPAGLEVALSRYLAAGNAVRKAGAAN